jgi:hypothetical protein
VSDSRYDLVDFRRITMTCHCRTVVAVVAVTIVIVLSRLPLVTGDRRQHRYEDHSGLTVVAVVRDSGDSVGVCVCGVVRESGDSRAGRWSGAREW